MEDKDQEAKRNLNGIKEIRQINQNQEAKFKTGRHTLYSTSVQYSKQYSYNYLSFVCVIKEEAKRCGKVKGWWRALVYVTGKVKKCKSYLVGLLLYSRSFACLLTL